MLSLSPRPEYFEDQMSSGPSLHPTTTSSSLPPLPTAEGHLTSAQQATPPSAHDDPSTTLARHFEHPNPPPAYQGLNHSEALIRKGQHLAAIQALATQFGGRTVDVSLGSVIVEITGKTNRLDAFLSLVRPYGILEAVRSGTSLVTSVGLMDVLLTPLLSRFVPHRCHGHAPDADSPEPRGRRGSLLGGLRDGRLTPPSRLKRQHARVSRLSSMASQLPCCS